MRNVFGVLAVGLLVVAVGYVSIPLGIIAMVLGIGLAREFFS